MGLLFITEGAIPFGAAAPARAIPSFIVGSALTGALVVGMAGIKLMAPHGGIFVWCHHFKCPPLPSLHLDWCCGIRYPLWIPPQTT